MSYQYYTYPDNLNENALSPFGGTNYIEVTPLSQLLYRGGRGQVNVDQTNPAMALYSSGDRNMYTASAYSAACDNLCLGGCPDPRLKVVKPLYTQWQNSGVHPSIYETNGMY